MRRGSGGRQRGLLDKVVMGDIGVHGSSEKPERALRLLPVEAKRTKKIVKRNGREGRNGNTRNSVDPALLRETGQGSELRLAGGTVGDTGSLVYVFEGGEEPQLV